MCENNSQSTLGPGGTFRDREVGGKSWGYQIRSEDEETQGYRHEIREGKRIGRRILLEHRVCKKKEKKKKKEREKEGVVADTARERETGRETEKEKWPDV